MSNLTDALEWYDAGHDGFWGEGARHVGSLAEAAREHVSCGDREGFAVEWCWFHNVQIAKSIECEHTCRRVRATVVLDG